MVSSKLKKRFEDRVRLAVEPLGRLGLTPNMLTILGAVIATISAYTYTRVSVNKVYLVYCGLLILLSGFVDAIDGVLARSTGNVTSFGGFFDSIADRYSDAIIYTGIITAGLCNLFIGLITLFTSLMVSYSRARAEAENVSMSGIGFAERAERMILLSFSSLAAFYWAPALNYGIATIAVLALITLAQRILYFKKEIEKK